MECKKHFRKRDAILTCLRQTTVHPSAEWIYTQLKSEIPDLSMGTVYRNLTLFKEQGRIVSVGTVKGVERFDGNTDPHVHFICQECDAVIDLMDMQIPDTLKGVAETSSGGQVNECTLCFSGLCQECLVKSKGASA